ncbi:acetyl-CoA carboxylase [Phytohalomonas tamaricis]|uniref:acetyl-CoA carboxylase n=1 Tax=Phytohalomonas tamaricis TaxID=2081032 RepID=UPI000D0AF856|nr:acetyl-CoA carboxylase [Phytohalomonas tamaricis]
MTETALKAPFPGVFYRSPSPDDAPFLEEGQAITAGDTIGLLEVMKQFSEIPAEVSGTVVRFVVEDEAVVEAGQTLLIVASDE